VTVLHLLRDRGIEPTAVTPLAGGEKNDSWLVRSPSGRFVARRYRASTVPEVEYELHACEFLARRGFPTPAPVRARDGALWGLLDGRPAAVFAHAPGSHPTGLADGAFSADLALGRRVAALAGRMHALADGRDFPGRRADRRDPLRRIARFLDSPHARLPALREATEALTAQRDRMAAVHADPAGLRHGLTHHDLSPANVLLDPDTGEVTAVLDFDDCATTFQLYDLGRIAETWARAADRHADPGRVEQLVAAYHAVRPLTGREADLALDLIATYAAATGVDVLTGMLRDGRPVRDPRDSYSMLYFLDLRQVLA
jgi:homoserine kinase type II